MSWQSSLVSLSTELPFTHLHTAALYCFQLLSLKLQHTGCSNFKSTLNLGKIQSTIPTL